MTFMPFGHVWRPPPDLNLAPMTPRPLSPKGARREIARVYSLAPLGERVSVSRRQVRGLVRHDIM